MSPMSGTLQAPISTSLPRVGLSSQPRLAGSREASASASGVAFRASVMALAGGRLGLALFHLEYPDLVRDLRLILAHFNSFHGDYDKP